MLALPVATFFYSYAICSVYGFLIVQILPWAVQSYRVLWTGLGAQLARDVPFSAICWSTLEPVRSSFLFLVLWRLNGDYIPLVLSLKGVRVWIVRHLPSPKPCFRAGVRVLQAFIC